MADCDLSSLQETLLDFARERDWQQFHAPKNLAMALSVEAAELMEHFQWLDEAQSRMLAAEKKQAVSLEMADIFIYLLRLATELEVDLLAAVKEKIEINARKYPAERVRGSAKKYTEYE
ncbi:MAG TPA: nucleotide pyrophosphohydrolase [Gammaproteobacteria bacterium]|nr:nucleotide pyrophosphohydrolase [Gammaproteobacteria bacterium]